MRSSTSILVLVALVLALAISTANCNSEDELMLAMKEFAGDALIVLKKSLSDPSNVLQSWDPTLVNPCTWFHVTCNSDNSVTRLDLGDAGLSGHLVPQLKKLTNLQYLELYGNKLTGTIPADLGKLTSLVSLDLYSNNLSGPIPASLGNLRRLRFLRLDNNKLSGKLPDSIIQLVKIGQLQILNVSLNNLAGTIRATNQTGFAVTTITQDPKALGE